MSAAAPAVVRPLHPQPLEEKPLQGLFLEHRLDRRAAGGAPFIYTNFLASLDGRIAVEGADTGRLGVPRAIANDDDWRLFQELAAQAEVVAVSGQFLRPGADKPLAERVPLDARHPDLAPWRQAAGLSPQPALLVVSGRLDLDFDAIAAFDRPLYIATGDAAAGPARARAEQAGAEVWTCGAGARVDGGQLRAALGRGGFGSVYVVAGPQVLHTLMVADALDRLYLTQAHCLLGGRNYQALVEGDGLPSGACFELAELYYQAPRGQGLGQQFAVFDRRRAA